jgi:hypothetical protein
VATAIKALRDFVATMHAPTTALHGLTPATRAVQVRLYDEALTAATKGCEKATTGQAPIRAYYARHR